MSDILVGFLSKFLVSLIVSFFLVWVRERSSKSSLFSKEKVQLELLASFLSWPLEKRHNALVEETFRNYFGVIFKYSELIFVLSLKNPMYVFNLLKSCKRYVEFSEENKCFELLGRLNEGKKFKRVLKLNFASYIFFASVSLLPLMYSPMLIGEHGMNALITILVFTIFGLFFSVSFLLENDKMEKAKEVIVQQALINK